MADDTYARQREYEERMAESIKQGRMDDADVWQGKLQAEFNQRTASERQKTQVAKRQAIEAKNRGVPFYDKGGKVKDTGLAFLHEGEEVIPEDKTKPKSRAASVMSKKDDDKGKKKSKKKKDSKKEAARKRRIRKMHLERSANGGYIAEHDYYPGEDKLPVDSERFALSDMDGLHGHMDEHMGPEEEMPEEEPVSEEMGEIEGMPTRRRPQMMR